jgi:hypothetical protein
MSDGNAPDMTGRATARLEELPADELIVYGRELGLALDAQMDRQQLLLRIRDRQSLLAQIEHEALLDIVIWARRPVRKSSTKEELAREVAAIRKVETTGLGRRGLVALMKLRGIPVNGDEPTEVLSERLRSNEPFWDRVVRHRRRVVGRIIGHFLEGPQEPQDNEREYRFLPESTESPGPESRPLRAQIADEGVMGGIARRLRGVADDYVREKLDEIELRIDRKLDEIDRRLEEWRDREIANRLRIIRITLVASILVALLSLGYSLVRPH